MAERIVRAAARVSSYRYADGCFVPSVVVPLEDNLTLGQTLEIAREAKEE